MDGRGVMYYLMVCSYKSESVLVKTTHFYCGIMPPSSLELPRIWWVANPSDEFFEWGVDSDSGGMRCKVNVAKSSKIPCSSNYSANI